MKMGNSEGQKRAKPRPAPSLPRARESERTAKDRNAQGRVLPQATSAVRAKPRPAKSWKQRRTESRKTAICPKPPRQATTATPGTKAETQLQQDERARAREPPGEQKRLGPTDGQLLRNRASAYANILASSYATGQAAMQTNWQGIGNTCRMQKQQPSGNDSGPNSTAKHSQSHTHVKRVPFPSKVNFFKNISHTAYKKHKHNTIIHEIANKAINRSVPA